MTTVFVSSVRPDSQELLSLPSTALDTQQVENTQERAPRSPTGHPEPLGLPSTAPEGEEKLVVQNSHEGPQQPLELPSTCGS